MCTILEIDHDKCQNLESLLNYLYKNHYEEIVNINENESIAYYDTEKHGLIATSNLFLGFNVYCIENYIDEYKSSLDITFDFIEKNMKMYSYRENKEKITFNLFKNMVKFLCDFCGEYNDKILKIENNAGKWKLNMRCEFDNY